MPIEAVEITFSNYSNNPTNTHFKRDKSLNLLYLTVLMSEKPQVVGMARLICFELDGKTVLVFKPHAVTRC